MKLLKRGIAFIITLGLVITAFAGMTFAKDETNITAKVNGGTKDIEVFEGDTFTITLSTKSMLVKSFTGGIGYDDKIVKISKYVSNDPDYPNDFSINKKGAKYPTPLSLQENASGDPYLGFYFVGTEEAEYDKTPGFVAITFEAKKAGDAGIFVYEDSDGTNGCKSDNVNPGFNVKVKEDTLESIVVATAPNKTSYHAGEKFNKAGMVVNAVYASGAKRDITSTCTVDTTTALKIEDKTVKISYNGKEVTQAITVSAHTYKSTWGWNKDQDGFYTGATLTLECTADGCDDTQSPTVTVESKRTEPTCENKGSIAYTAKASYSGKNYSDTKSVDLDALGHDYTDVEPTWSWSDDKSEATAKFECKRDGCDHVEEVAATVTSEQTKAPKCEVKGEKTYTAKAEAGTAYSEKTDTKTAEIAALGHDYTGVTPVFTWTGNETDGYTAAYAEFACDRKGCSHVEKVDATITSKVTTEPTCHSTGVKTFTATVKLGDITKTEEKKQTLAMVGHEYELQKCVFAEDNKSAQITLKCKHCTHTETPSTTVTSQTTDPKCTEKGKTVYTAKATFEGKEYSSEKTVEINALGHDYTGVEPTWSWSKDKSEATAKFECKRDGCDHVEEVAATVTSEQTKAPKCEVKGEKTYTAKAKAGTGYEEYTGTAKVDVDALGHKWDEGKIIKESSPTEKGKIEYKCTREGCNETKVEEFGTENKVEMSSKIELTVELQNAGFTSEEKVKEKLDEQILKDSKFDKKDITTYDITLMISFDNGRTYVPATKDNFPENGIDLVIPYPAGTGQNDDFIVTHMFTTTTDEHKAGDVEVLKITKTKEGLKVHVNSLSPFAVGAKVAKSEPETKPEKDNPGTGDSNNTFTWLIVLAIALITIGSALFFKNKGKDNR